MPCALRPSFPCSRSINLPCTSLVNLNLSLSSLQLLSLLILAPDCYFVNWMCSFMSDTQLAPDTYLLNEWMKQMSMVLLPPISWSDSGSRLFLCWWQAACSKKHFGIQKEQGLNLALTLSFITLHTSLNFSKPQLLHL